MRGCSGGPPLADPGHGPPGVSVFCGGCVRLGLPGLRAEDGRLLQLLVCQRHGPQRHTDHRSVDLSGRLIDGVLLRHFIDQTVRCLADLSRQIRIHAAHCLGKHVNT